MGRRKAEAADRAKTKAVNLNPKDSAMIHDKDFFAGRVKALRTAAGMTQAELGRRLGLTRSAVLNWEIGHSRPDIGIIPALCRALKVTASDFFAARDGKANMEPDELRLVTSFRGLSAVHQAVLLKIAQSLEDAETEEVRALREPIALLKIPYAVDSVAAGVSMDYFEANCEAVYVHDTPALREADILFRVNGDSMEPDYPDHCTVMVEEETDLSEGEIGIFSVDGSLYIKELGEEGLVSLNPDYKTMKAPEYGEIRTIGRVIGIMDQHDFASGAEIREYEAGN